MTSLILAVLTNLIRESSERVKLIVIPDLFRNPALIFLAKSNPNLYEILKFYQCENLIGGDFC
jgi:hypothetical protein